MWEGLAVMLVNVAALSVCWDYTKAWEFNQELRRLLEDD